MRQLKIRDDTFLINRDLLTRFKVNVNPNRKFVLSHWIERYVVIQEGLIYHLKR